MPFHFERTEIPEVIVITPKSFDDERGFFMETYKSSEFKKNGIDFDFVQDNHSLSKKGVIRGIHFQREPMAQGKLVRVTHGKLFDVAVDLRKQSPTYKKWVGVVLSAENRKMLWVPPGFGHGICALEENTELLYKVTHEYSPELDGGIRWDDPDISVNWPLNKSEAIVSNKDKNLPYLRDINLDF